MILTASVNGYGKRTPVDAYRLQGRGGSGVINIDATDRNGEVVGMKAVCDTDELMLITEKGHPDADQDRRDPRDRPQRPGRAADQSG